MSQPETHRKSDLDFHSQSVTEPAAPDERKAAAAIAAAIEHATGEQPGDRLTQTLLRMQNKTHLPTGAMVRWIYDFVQDRRAAGYQVKAGLLATAAGAGILPWIKANAHMIEEKRRAEALAQQQAEAPHQMPTTTPEFSRDLLTDLQHRRQKRG